MLVRPAEDSFRKGMEALAQGEGVKALALFEAAIRLDRRYREDRPQPRYLSFYGLCLGLQSQRWKEAVDLCRDAVTAESYNADLHLNLGRVLLAAGRRREAWEVLQRGLKLEEQHEGLLRAVAAMGTRRRPALPFLDRRHPINVLLGKISKTSPPAKKAAPEKKAAKGPGRGRPRTRTATGRG